MTQGRRVAEGFGDRLRKELARLGWTQKQLADEMKERYGVGRQGTVSDWVAGTIPDSPNLEQLAEILEVDPGYLRFGSIRHSKAAETLDLVRDVIRMLDEDPARLQAIRNTLDMVRRAKENDADPPGEGDPPP